LLPPRHSSRPEWFKITRILLRGLRYII